MASSEARQRSRGWRAFLFSWVLASVGILAICLLVVAGVWLFNGLDTDGETLDWNVVAALAAMGAAIATTGAIAALQFAATEVEIQSREERIARNPYLRIDLAFAEDEGRSAGFSPPVSEHIFTVDDFRLGPYVAPLAGLAPGPGDESFTLTLWITNKQPAQLGAAYNVRIFLTIAWPSSEERSVADHEYSLLIELAYVESGKTTAIALGPVRRSLSQILASVTGVEYQDIFGGEVLTDHHGAVGMVYNGLSGEVLNERSYKLSR